jgi:hypothetical protein
MHYIRAPCGNTADAFEDDRRRRLRVGPELERFQATVVMQHYKIGKSASGIDSYPHGKYNGISTFMRLTRLAPAS